MIRIRSPHRSLRSLTLVAVSAATLLLVPAGAAWADGPHGRGHGHRYGHGHGHAHGPVYVAPRVVAPPYAFVAPIHLTPPLVYANRSYLAGDFYFAPHRHRHVVYSFPVVVPGGAVAYRPHVYCGGVLLRDAWIPRDGHDGWVDLGFRLPGLSVDARIPLDD